MRKAIAVIGEGITEKYYIESLRGLSPFTLLPKELGKKASSLAELENSIKQSIEDGYDQVYCLSIHSHQILC
ncbi:MAG: RloB family protein [Bacteroides sp.]|nr:RloB family protein [Bacteroides sp.]